MTTSFVLCPDCDHAKRRHNSTGCTVFPASSTGGCLCNRAADEILDDATTTKPDAEPATKPDTETGVTVQARQPKPTTIPEVKVEIRQPSRSPVENILARARDAGGKLAARANRIQALVIDLDRDLAEWERVADAEHHVQDLRRQLDEANAKLRELRGTPRPAAAPATNGDIPTDAQLRRWAANAGVPCGAVGKVGTKVIAAWRAAGSPNLDSEVAA